jgi:hypothetical protein
MTARESILAEIENIRDEDLDELSRLIRVFTAMKSDQSGQEDLLSKLKRIKIRGPEDFSENFDLYVSGEKPLEVDEDLH